MFTMPESVPVSFLGVTGPLAGDDFTGFQGIPLVNLVVTWVGYECGKWFHRYFKGLGPVL